MTATPTSAGSERRAVDRAELPGLPEGLYVAEHPPAQGRGGAGDRPTVVLVHGSLDRAASFNRVLRRLDDLRVVTYDRRGYARSRAAPVSDDLAVHVDDLVRIAAAAAAAGAAAAVAGRGPGVVAVGHSVGASIVLGAAVAAPGRFDALGAYEPSMPWLGFHRQEPAREPTARDGPADPGVEAERFFRRIVGAAAWDRLLDEQQAALRADGPALLADLRAIRRGPPFDVTALAVPAIVASGGPSSFPQHLDTADWLAAHVLSARRSTIPDAAHGAHLSHPDAFAAFVRDVVALGTGAAARD